MYGGGRENPNFCCKCSQPPLGERLGESSAGREGSSRSGCLRSRALSLLGLCSKPCLQATAARTRHLPPGYSRGLAGGAAGMWRADCGRLSRRAPGGGGYWVARAGSMPEAAVGPRRAAGSSARAPARAPLPPPPLGGGAALTNSKDAGDSRGGGAGGGSGPFFTALG